MTRQIPEGDHTVHTPPADTQTTTPPDHIVIPPPNYKMRSVRDLIQHVRASRKGVRLRLGPAADPSSSLLARLPIELHIMLLTYLDQEDVVAALDASKLLRLVWLSEDIWPWLAGKWHPGLAEALRTEAGQPQKSESFGQGKNSPSATGLDPGVLFLQRLRRISRRTTGKYASMLHLGMELEADPVFSLSKNVPQADGGIHSLDDLGEEMEVSLKRANHPVSPFVRLMVYNHGRIAWWPESFTAPYIAVVDDLRTAKRRIYQFPNHGNIQKGYKTAMSDRLLVLAREKMLHAWHFDTDVLASIKVPEPFERCIAEGPVVLIITRTSIVYKWEFGRPLEPIAFSSLGCYQPGPIRVGGLVDSPLQVYNAPFHILRRQGLVFQDSGMLLDFIPHPCLRHVIFVVTMLHGRVAVHETNQGTLVRTYHLQDETAPLPDSWKQINEYLRWEKCDSYGGYRLFSAYVGAVEGFSPADLPCPEGPCCTCTLAVGLVSVCFNVYTRRFNVLCHHFLSMHGARPPSGDVSPQPAAFHLWDTKLYVSYKADIMQAGMPMTALRCCRAVQEETFDDIVVGDTPVYTTSESSSRDILARRHTTLPEELLNSKESNIQPVLRRVELAFGLDVTSSFAVDSVGSHSSSTPAATTLWNWTGYHIHQTIIGDDDFLVYVVDGAYMVWSFGDEIHVPKYRGAKWAPWRRTVDQFRKI